MPEQNVSLIIQSKRELGAEEEEEDAVLKGVSNER